MTGFNQWLLVSDLRSTIARDVREPTFLEMRRGRGTGAELLLRVADQARVHGWLGYTLSWSVREFDGVDAPSDWDQRHIVNLVAAARLGRGYSVGGRFHYGSGRPYPVRTPLQTVEYQRLPAFWQVDLRADKRMIFDRYRLDLFLELANATLTRQVTALAPVDDPFPHRAAVHRSARRMVTELQNENAAPPPSCVTVSFRYSPTSLPNSAMP